MERRTPPDFLNEESTVLRNSIVAPALIATLTILAGCTGSPYEEARDGSSEEAADHRSQQRPTPAQADEPARDEPASASAQETETQHPLGSPRNDLQRFHGVYGEAGGRRNFFVSEASAPAGENPVPPGYLMVGTMWGDVQPWHMKSLAETRFEQVYVSQFQSEPLLVEFHLGGDGRAVALTFSGMFEDRGRLERIGDLPDGW